MNKKEKQPKDMATALDYAIRDFEISEDPSKKYGYKINKIYNNYMSNDNWESFKNSMPEDHRNQFKNGSGGELEEKKGRWGKYPPKMASFGSSSQMIYELSKDIKGFCFEAQLDTRVGGIANLDGFLKKGNEYIYVEAKRREIYGSSHKNEDIKDVYVPVYDAIKKTCGKDKFHIEENDAKEEGVKKITFYLNNQPVQYFDLKQLICHFLGITYNLATQLKDNVNVKFLYLIFNPEDIKGNIVENYQKKISDRYDNVVEFIKKNNGIIKEIFQAILKYQSDIHNLPKPEVSFEFILVDQNNYKDKLK